MRLPPYTARLFAVCVCAASSACGVIPTPADNPEVEPTFRIYYSRWLADAARYQRELSLKGLRVRMGQPGELSDRIGGMCMDGKIVVINPAAWASFKHDHEAELLMYHEFGHCTLGQDHRPIPSIMNPGLMSWAYLRDREEYKREVFTFFGFVLQNVTWECEWNW